MGYQAVDAYFTSERKNLKFLVKRNMISGIKYTCDRQTGRPQAVQYNDIDCV